MHATTSNEGESPESNAMAIMSETDTDVAGAAEITARGHFWVGLNKLFRRKTARSHGDSRPIRVALEWSTDDLECPDGQCLCSACLLGNNLP